MIESEAMWQMQLAGDFAQHYHYLANAEAS